MWVESGGETALKEAQKLYKKADKKVKISAKADKIKYIDGIATKAQNVPNKGDQHHYTAVWQNEQEKRPHQE